MDTRGPDKVGNGTTVMRTISGALVDFLNPDPEQIRLGDLLRGLSREPRYVGHTTTNFSWVVIDHLVLAVALSRVRYPEMPPEFHAAVFLHDAHEGYIGDLISPLKEALKYLGAEAAVSRIASGLDEAIHVKMGVPYPLPVGWHEKIKAVDIEAFRVEEARFRPDPVEYDYLPPGLKESDVPKPLQSDAERMLRGMECWHGIMAQRITAATVRRSAALEASARVDESSTTKPQASRRHSPSVQ